MSEVQQYPEWIACLARASELLGQSRRPLQVQQGLPRLLQQPDPELLARAAENAGLALQPARGQLADLPLPALYLGEAGVCLVVSTEGDSCELWQPSGSSSVAAAVLVKGTLYALSLAEVTDARSAFSNERQRHWLWRALDEVRPWYRDVLLASLVVNVLGLVVPLFTMNVYDRVVPNLAFNTLWVLASGVFIALAFDWALRQARNQMADVAGRQVDVKVSARLFSRVLNMQLEHRPASAGAFARQVQEFDAVRDFLTSATLVTAIDLPFTLLFLALIAWLGGWMVLIPVLAITAILVAAWSHHRRLAAQLETTARLHSQRQAQLVETLQVMPEVKQNNAEPLLQQRWENTVSALADENVLTRSLSNRLSHTVLSMQQFVTAGLIVAGVYQIAAGALSMGGLIAVVMLSGRAASAVNQLAMLMLRFEQTRAALRGLDTVLDLPQERQGGRSLEAPRFEGRISLRHLGFAYPEQSLPALQDMNIEFAPGERVALVGPPGAGKSTLLQVLAGQYQAPAGQLFYDDVDSTLWSPVELREAMAWVPQQPVLMYGSLLENIALGSATVSREALARVLRQSGIDHFMDRLENGLETAVGEQGRNLSGGQRQAVALARALLRDASMLLLDEPTSAMDSRTENQVASNLRSLPEGCGFIVATHRPAMIATCDRVITLDRGRVVADMPADEFRRSASQRVQSVRVVPRDSQEANDE